MSPPRVVAAFTNLYPVWLIIAAFVGVVRPETLAWFSGPWIFWALATVMLAMGFTLTVADFRRLLQMPQWAAAGFVLQYTVMPLAGWLVARMLHLEPGLAAGLILVASCPGGTASNVITFLAGANVALSVVLTMASTLLAFVMTPLWCESLANRYVPVDAWGLCVSTLQIVVAPVLIGVCFRSRLPRLVTRIAPFGPFASVIAIFFITGGIVAQNASLLVNNLGVLVIATTLLHVTGFGVGYAVCRLLKQPVDVARTVAIEVGMQNGGMATVLAKRHFVMEPLAVLPGVFSAVVQNLLGSLMAAWWRRRPVSPARLAPHPRSLSYYWKCDRPAAYHGIQGNPSGDSATAARLIDALRRTFQTSAISVRPAATQGNHRAFIAEIDGNHRFVRLEDGSDGDDYMEVESALMERLREAGVATPRVHAVDASRRLEPFAWQVMDYLPERDLNHLAKEGVLELGLIAPSIGAAIATWQGIQTAGFGPFDPEVLRKTGRFLGFHSSYAAYFRLHLSRHLECLRRNDLLTPAEITSITEAIDFHSGLLDLKQGCLVHKDLALWNILGTATAVRAFIDWDDAINGDPMDDVSLLGCFHDGPVLSAVLQGYATVRPLPDGHVQRFWLHLLRNMIVKAVIRAEAGYFERSDSFFLIPSGGSGASLRTGTRQRLLAALDGLLANRPIAELHIN